MVSTYWLLAIAFVSGVAWQLYQVGKREKEKPPGKRFANFDRYAFTFACLKNAIGSVLLVWLAPMQLDITLKAWHAVIAGVGGGEGWDLFVTAYKVVFKRE